MSIKHKIDFAVDACHKASSDAGWWTDGDGNHLSLNPMCFATKLALVHSELSEALEADRKDLMDDKLPHLHGRATELADAVIRIFDLAGAYNIELGEAIEQKMAFNKVRPDHKKEAREAAGGKKY